MTNRARARMARVIATAMRVAGNLGGQWQLQQGWPASDGNSDEDSDGDEDKGGGRAMATAMKNKDDGGSGNGNENYGGNSDVGGKYNNQLKASEEEMVAAAAMATST